MTPGTTPFFSSSDIQGQPPSGGFGATAVRWSIESASAGWTSQPTASPGSGPTTPTASVSVR